MYHRNITSKLIKSLEDTPVIFINGARQVGKSTLVEWLAQEKYPAKYITLDDQNILAAVSSDPQGFIHNLEGPVIIDEIQRVPELFLNIKQSVDKNRKPGRFILTGSANVLLLPKLSDSLVGRMEILTLWPFSESEILQKPASFASNLFKPSNIKNIPPLHKDQFVKRLITGGYPEAVQRQTSQRREAWFNSYITTILQRDIRDLANIENLTTMPRLLSLLAARTTSLLNYAELSRTTGLAQSTLKRYLSLLETTFLYKTLPAWSANLSKRLVKSSKIMLCDTGLSCYLTGADVDKLSNDQTSMGSILENFVCMELCKQLSWHEKKLQLFHFRSSTGSEIDFIIEDLAGRIVALEVKSRATIKADDFKAIKSLAQETSDRFAAGVVLYCGNESIPFGKNLFALPISALWA
ncbi:MAG: ATP-binding protein [Syntrophaceae bacterium]|nr:ATP-binding protein [Syntrophaceae bacterium]